MVQLVEKRAKALKYDRKWLRQAERCAAAAAELVEKSPDKPACKQRFSVNVTPIGKVVLALEITLQLWRLVSRCTWACVFPCNPRP